MVSGQKFLHRQSRVSRGIVMIEKPISSAPFTGMFSSRLPLDATKHLCRNGDSEFIHMGQIPHAQLNQCKKKKKINRLFTLELTSLAFPGHDKSELCCQEACCFVSG
jgi:hypothetical protein